MGIRKWIGNLHINPDRSLLGCDHVPQDVKKVLFKGLKNAGMPPEGLYLAYLVLKLGGCTLELTRLGGKQEVTMVDIHRTLLFDGEHAVTLQQMLEEGKDMEAVKIAKVVPVVEHRGVGLTLPAGPMVGVKLKPDPFGFHT